MTGVTNQHQRKSRLEIRRIQVGDVHSFVDLWSRVYSEGAFLAKGPPPEDRVRSIIEKVVKEGIPNFVAVEKSQVIGAVEVFPGPMCGRKYDGAEKTGHLGIQVDSSHRRRGIGKHLMMTAISDSARFGYRAIELSVFESNVAAIRLYESLGFLTSGHGLAVTLPAGISTRAQHMVFNIVQNNAPST